MGPANSKTAEIGYHVTFIGLNEEHHFISRLQTVFFCSPPCSPIQNVFQNIFYPVLDYVKKNFFFL